MSLMSGIYWLYLFHEEMKTSISTTQFSIQQFQTNAQTQYFQMHLLEERLFLWLNIVGFLEEGVKTYRMAPMSPLHSRTFFSVFTSTVYVCIG
jgi:hypothetical protein